MASRSYNILVVDDNIDYADSLAALLDALGHAVDVAYDGPSAINWAESKQHDLVLCDIGMPGMNGYEVAKAIRPKLSTATTLIAVSGYTQAHDVKRSLDAGFDAHFAKPLDRRRIEEIFDRIK